MDNENGHVAEPGKRNYRPELPAEHPREHKAWVFTRPVFDNVIVPRMVRAGAQHRLAFMAAALEVGGYFLDMFQTVHDLPYPTGGERFCGILNDDEPTRTGARGPSFFHQSSLSRLVSSCDSVVVNTIGVVPYVYVQAANPTAYGGLRSLIIETEYQQGREWMAYCQTQCTKGRLAFVVGEVHRSDKFSIIAQPTDVIQ